MPGKRVSMRKTREVLRLYFELKLGQRQVARSANLSQSTVHEYLKRFESSGLSWPLPAGMSEADLEKRLFTVDEVKPGSKTVPDFARIHEELQRHKHTTLQLLREEYRAVNPDGYRYSQFCHHYQNWKQERDLVLRQEHRPGEKLFVDWAGTTTPVFDPSSGEAHAAQLFVAVLGASKLYLCRSYPGSADGQLDRSACALLRIPGRLSATGGSR